VTGRCVDAAPWRRLEGGAELRLLRTDDAPELHALIEANRERLVTELSKGTMTQAVQALVEHAFSVWELNRVEIRVAPDNQRSAAIPLRLGFEYEGTLRQAQRIGDRYVDLAVYALLAAGQLAGRNAFSMDSIEKALRPKWDRG